MKPLCHLLAAMLLISSLLPSCKKGGTKPETSGTTFPFGTRWAGTMHLTGWRYDQPCGLEIREDQTVRVYSLFAFAAGNDIVEKDSLSAAIMAVDSSTGAVRITVQFPDLPHLGGTGTLVITDNNKLSYEGGDGNFLLHLERFTDKKLSVVGEWTGPVMHGGPLEGFHAYPDLSSVVFYDNGMTNYWRQGAIVKVKYPTSPDYIPVALPYRTDLPMVWMQGFNEKNGKPVAYFGVMLPDGTSMLADSRNSIDGRLPSYLATIDWNGPKGVTPVIYRQ